MILVDESSELGFGRIEITFERIALSLRRWSKSSTRENPNRKLGVVHDRDYDEEP